MSSPAVFPRELLHYLQETVLNPQFAAPEDLTYFGTTCFDSCVQQFAVRAMVMERDGTLDNVMEELADGRGLSVFATCAGVCVTYCHTGPQFSLLCCPERCNPVCRREQDPSHVTQTCLFNLHRTTCIGLTLSLLLQHQSGPPE